MENQNELNHINDAFEERVKQAVALTEREQLMSFLNKIEDEYQDKEKKATVRTLPNRRWMSVAASLLLVAAAFFIFRLSSSTSPDQLITAHYEAYPNGYKPITRSQPQKVDNEILGLIAYEGGQYDEALKYFSQIEINDDIRMFKAIAFFEEGNSKSAESELKTLINTNSRLLRPAQWYMGLLLLKEGSVDRAKEYFSILASQPSDSSYQKDASEILKELK